MEFTLFYRRTFIDILYFPFRTFLCKVSHIEFDITYAVVTPE